MSQTGCTWKKIDGRYRCMATKCPHRLEGGGCKLGKVSLTCDNKECMYNSHEAPIYGCLSMDVHLDADGKCLGFNIRLEEAGDHGGYRGDERKRKG